MHDEAAGLAAWENNANLVEKEYRIYMPRNPRDFFSTQWHIDEASGAQN